MVSLEKVYNFRQAGGFALTNKDGHKVKDGMLYRSARLDSATQKDKSVFKELGIKSIIDLRGISDYSKRLKKPMEDTYTPIVIQNGLAREQSSSSSSRSSQVGGYLYIIDILTKRYGWHTIKKVNVCLQLLLMMLIPIDLLFGTRLTLLLLAKLVINKQEVWEHYVDILECSKPEVAQVLRLVSDPLNMPALIHCELGKDRTGYVTALILSCLGVEDEAIINDYVKSEQQLQPIIEKVEESMRRKYGTEDRFAHAEPDNMRLMLQELRNRYGSVSKYIASTGFIAQEQEKLKELLLEDYDQQ